MLAVYNGAEICAYNEPFKCGLRLQPHLTTIMARSRDWDELQHVWSEWRRHTGLKFRDLYEQLVDLTNQAARLNSKTTYLINKRFCRCLTIHFFRFYKCSWILDVPVRISSFQTRCWRCLGTNPTIVWTTPFLCKEETAWSSWTWKSFEVCSTSRAYSW